MHSRSIGRIKICLAILFTCAQPANAQTVLGHGNQECSVFIAVAKNADSSDLIYTSFTVWILGYVSGVNFVMNALLKQPDFLMEPSPEVILNHAKKYCLLNPDKTVVNAANDYVIKQTKR